MTTSITRALWATDIVLSSPPMAPPTSTISFSPPGVAVKKAVTGS